MQWSWKSPVFKTYKHIYQPPPEHFTLAKFWSSNLHISWFHWLPLHCDVHKSTRSFLPNVSLNDTFKSSKIRKHKSFRLTKACFLFFCGTDILLPNSFHLLFSNPNFIMATHVHGLLTRMGQLHWDLAQCIETIVTPRVEGLHLFAIYTPGVVMSYVAFSLWTLHRSTLRRLIGEGAVPSRPWDGPPPPIRH